MGQVVCEVVCSSGTPERRAEPVNSNASASITEPAGTWRGRERLSAPCAVWQEMIAGWLLQRNTRAVGRTVSGATPPKKQPRCQPQSPISAMKPWSIGTSTTRQCVTRATVSKAETHPDSSVWALGAIRAKRDFRGVIGRCGRRARRSYGRRHRQSRTRSPRRAERGLGGREEWLRRE